MTPLEARQQVIDAIGEDWWHVNVIHTQSAASWNSFGGVNDTSTDSYTITWTTKTNQRREVIERTLDEALAHALELIAAERTLNDARRAIVVGNIVTALTNQSLRTVAVA